MKKNPTIELCKYIANKSGARGVIVMCIDDKTWAATSYGKTKEECEAIKVFKNTMIDNVLPLLGALGMLMSDQKARGK